MLDKCCTFHGDIAVTLESIACEFFEYISRPFDKIFDADSIQGGTFIEVMIILLREKTNFDNSFREIDSFISKCQPYLSKKGDEIELQLAKELFDEFCEIFKR